MGIVVVDQQAAILVRHTYLSIFSSCLGMIALMITMTNIFLFFVAAVFAIFIPLLAYRSLKTGHRVGLQIFRGANLIYTIISLFFAVLFLVDIIGGQSYDVGGNKVSWTSGLVYILCFVFLALIFGLAYYRVHQLLITAKQRPIWVLANPAAPPTVATVGPAGVVIGAPVVGSSTPNPYATGLNSYGDSAFGGAAFNLDGFDDEDDIAKEKKKAKDEYEKKQKYALNADGLALAEEEEGLKEKKSESRTKKQEENEQSNSAVVDLLGVSGVIDPDDDLNVYKNYGEKTQKEENLIDSSDEEENTDKRSSRRRTDSFI
eukprot:GDKJ01057146.1.p1 GENE.GDKJ01057146.1~~GDKJ01057146.1.p1  ORF type:complete len:351 (+),score=79.90 GDKJ01057146.1:105-1055(+)